MVKMNKKGQSIDFEGLIKLGGVIIVGFFLFTILSAIANSIQDIQTSIETIVATFIPLIILAVLFELARRIFK